MMQYPHGYAHIDEWDNPISLVLSNQWIRVKYITIQRNFFSCWIHMSVCEQRFHLQQTKLPLLKHIWLCEIKVMGKKKKEYLWWLITSRIGKLSTVVSLTISLVILSHYNIFMCINWKDMQMSVCLITSSWKCWNNRGRVGSVSIVMPKQSWWNSSRYSSLLHLTHTGNGIPFLQTNWDTHTDIDCTLPSGTRLQANPAFLKYPYGMEPFAYKIIYTTKNIREKLLKHV